MNNQVLAAFIALCTSLVLGAPTIKFLTKLKYGQVVRTDGPSSHLKKSGTPSMGGIIILFSILVSLIFTGAFKSLYVVVASVVIAILGFSGFLDDFIKIVKKRSLGLRAREKLLFQLFAAIVIAVFAYMNPEIGTKISIPFTNGFEIDLGFFYIPFVIIVVMATTNGVNLTDGLDGLAAGTVAIASFAYVVISIALRRFDMAVLAAAVGGACVGFAWFNSNPARVFMGDTGSLALGGALAVISVITKTELILMIVGGVFAIETLSVIIQVMSYKLLGKRVFKMAPIHHHYELCGLSETQIVTRFWIVAAVFGVLGFLAL